MKKVILLCTCLLSNAFGWAQSIERVDPLNDINAIKRDTSYIYAETTMIDVIEAQSGAHSVLELKIYDWLRSMYPDENADSLVTYSRNKWYDLLTRRGKYNRVFTYVSKHDIVSTSKLVRKNEAMISDQTQDKITFIKQMYKDFFTNSSFDREKLSDLRKYLTQDVAEKIYYECPYDGCDESDGSYIVDLFVDGSPSYERPDPGYRVVARTIKPLTDDWYKVSNIWDVIDIPIIVGVRVQNTEEGLRVVDFSTEWDHKIDGVSEAENAIEDWEMFVSPEEQKMIFMTSFYEIEPYIKQLKAANRINRYGKYATMPADDLCHLFVYNKDGEIVTVLFKTFHNTYNLKTREKDAISNYKNCGAIWFTLNGR